ncbi:MAG: hypothetical protein RIF44_06685 [Nitratireductor sp.]
MSVLEQGDYVMGAATRRSRRQRLVDLQEHLRELSQIAQADGLPLIGYFVEMAYLEACDTMGKERPFDAPENQNDALNPLAVGD